MIRQRWDRRRRISVGRLDWLFLALSLCVFFAALVRDGFHAALDDRTDDPSLTLRMDRFQHVVQYNEDAINTQLETSITATRVAVEELRRKVDDMHRKSSVTHPQILGRFAYAFVIGGCNPEDGAYRNYIFNILVAAKVLRDQGSRADVVAFFQLSYNTPDEQLPSDDTRLLDAMGIQYRYIPKDPNESFYSIVLEKFRVLTLVEYDRVLFMDGDVMPVTSLDYLFDLSMNGTLRENLIVAGTMEPSNAGFFMVQPEPGDYERVHSTIQAAHSRGASLPYPHWDKRIGWGHEIVEPDYFSYVADHKGHLWDFHCAFSDQGLLYHYTKYMKGSVSIGLHDRIENWSFDGEHARLLEIVALSSLRDHTVADWKCWPRQNRGKECAPPYSDFHHFTGEFKPWLNGPPANLADVSMTKKGKYFWYSHLQALNESLRMGLSFENWTTGLRPSLGMYATHGHSTLFHNRSQS